MTIRLAPESSFSWKRRISDSPFISCRSRLENFPIGVLMILPRWLSDIRPNGIWYANLT